MSDSNQKNDSENNKNNKNNKKNNNNPFLNFNGKGGQEPEGNGGLSPIAIWAIIFAVAVLILSFGRPDENKDISYSSFKKAVREGNIQSISFNDTSVLATGKYRDGTPYQVNILRGDLELPGLLEQNGVAVKVNSSNSWLTNLFFTLFSPLVFVFFLYIFIYRGMKGFGKGAMSFGKSKAKIAGDKDKVTFKDVAGIEEALDEVKEIIDFLKNPDKYREIGARLPKGVLLVGSPGTGKTLLARAIAGEAGVPFFSLCGSDFVEMFVGVGAARVRDLFEQGKKNAPCIMFLDEIDAVGRHRGAGLGGGHDEREQTLNALLVELDGFDSNSGVIMIAATNRPDVLDPALLRPGRFDRQIVVSLPDLKAREEILQVHARKVKLEKDVDLKAIAKATVYFSGADLANLINEAALISAREKGQLVGMKHLEEARDKVQFGRERKSAVVTEEDRCNTAWHEAGHAVVNVHCKHADPIHKVTIIPRGRAAGMVMAFPEEDRQGMTKNFLLDKICMSYGGRVAEMIKFNVESTGAVADIKAATNIARRMVCEWGMSPLGVQAYGNHEEHMFLGREISRTIDYSGATAKQIDEAIASILNEQYERALNILKDHSNELETLAEALLEYETLSGDEVKKLLNGETIGREKKSMSQKVDEAPSSDSNEPEESQDPGETPIDNKKENDSEAKASDEEQ